MSVIKYPTSIDDNVSLPLTTDNVTQVTASVVNNLRSAIIAVEQELGAEPSGVYGSVRARLDAINAVIDALTLGIAVPTGTVGGDLSGSLPNPNVVDFTITGQVQGSVLYFNGTNWVQLSPGTDGLVLTTHGTGANPTWAAGTSLLTGSAPVNVTKAAAAVGVAATAARADHKHDISTAIASSISTANAEGTATTLARSDHTHNVTNFNIASQVQGSILYYNGTSWVQLAPGTDGYFLTTHSSGQNPTWTASNIVQQVSSGLIPNWYVNASTGSDSNDGKSSGTAFATTDRLSQVLCPAGNRLDIQQNTAVYIAAGSYNSINLNISSPVGSGFSFDIFCDYTSSSSITLSSVINTVESSTPTRGRITTASGTFTLNDRIRSTSGSNIGAITYCTDINSSTDAFVKTWFLDSSTSVVNITNGTTCVVDTLQVTIKRIQIKTPGHPIGGTVIVHDAILPNGIEFINQISGSASLYATQCLIGSSDASRFAGNGQIRNSRIIGPASFSVLGTPQLVLWGSLIETTIQCVLPIQNAGGCCVRGGNIIVGSNTPSSSSEFAGTLGLAATEWLNGSGSAITITSGSSVKIIDQQYGFGTAYAVGLTLYGGSTAITDTVAHLGIIATQQIIMAGNNVSYSQVPISYPNSDCSFVLLTDTSSTANLFIPGQVQGDTIYFNGTNWVKLASGTDGYFLQTHGSGANPTWASALGTTFSNWYISDWYVNASTGNDSNNGLTSGTALKTIEELSNRLCPRGDVAFLKQATTVHVASGNYGRLYLDIGSNIITISCAISSTANITTNSITNSSSSGLIRGEIETASGTFVDYGRIRITSGANIGAIAFSTGLNGGSTKTFTSAFMNNAGTQVNITNGNNVVVDTNLVTFGNVVLFTTVETVIIINNAIITDANTSSGAVLNSCNFNTNTIILGGGTYNFCSFLNAIIANGNYQGFGNQFINSCLSSYANFTLTGISLFDDCNSFIGQDVTLNIVTAELIRRSNTVGFIIPSGSSMISTGYLWSGTGAYSNTAVQMDPGSYFSFGILPTVSALYNITIAGVHFSWSQLPQKVGSTSAEYNVIYTSAANDVSYWTGNYWERLAAGQDGYVLTTHGTSTAPNWAAAAAISLTIAGQTKGDVLYFDGNIWNRLPAGQDGYVLTTHGVSINPTWASANSSLGSSTAGKALIFNGSIWVAGGGGVVGDNELYSINIRTDGYVSAASIKLPSGNTILSKSATGSSNLSVYSSTTSINDVQTFGDANNNTTVLQSGASGGAGINLSPGGVQRVSISATQTALSNPLLTFSSAQSSPTINQASAASPSTNGQTLLLQSQSMTGARTRGGAINLASGTGVPLDPNINASDGYITISRGNNVVASWTDGYSDYISFGNAFNPAASAGAIRLPANRTIRSRDFTNSVDFMVYQGPSTVTNTQTFGDSANSSSILQAGGSVLLSIAGTTRFAVGAAYCQTETPSLFLDNSLGDGNVLLQHLTLASPNLASKTFTIAGQDRTGNNTRGGLLAIRSGTGLPLDTNINASDGYITISRGNNIVANWSDGYSDYVSLGSKFNPSSTTGNIRLPNSASITNRTVGGIDLSIYSSTAGAQVFGDTNSVVSNFVGGASGGVHLLPGGVDRFGINNSTAIFNIASIIVSNTASSSGDCLIQQNSVNSPNNAGGTFTIAARDRTGAALQVGGLLALRSGTGIAVDPNINATDGYITISRGNNIVANWGDGYSDYISLGSRFNPASTTGNVRLPVSGTIKSRNAANSADITLLGLDTNNNLVTTANSTSSATAGSASALPATPQEYITVVVNGNIRKLPLYLS